MSDHFHKLINSVNCKRFAFAFNDQEGIYADLCADMGTWRSRKEFRKWRERQLNLGYRVDQYDKATGTVTEMRRKKISDQVI